MKNKKILLIVGIVILVVVAGVVFSLNSKKGKNINVPISNVLGKNYSGGVKCIQHIVMDDLVVMDNTIYFYKNKTRTDSLTNYNDMPSRETHMISDENLSYMWGSGIEFPGVSGKSGMIISVDDEGEDMSDSIPVDVEDIKDNDYKMPGLECESWKYDSSLFELPKDVEFKDMQSMMMPSSFEDMTKTSGANGNVAMPKCEDICSYIPDEQSKQSCLVDCK